MLMHPILNNSLSVAGAIQPITSTTRSISESNSAEHGDWKERPDAIEDNHTNKTVVSILLILFCLCPGPPWSWSSSASASSEKAWCNRAITKRTTNFAFQSWKIEAHDLGQSTKVVKKSESYHIDEKHHLNVVSSCTQLLEKEKKSRPINFDQKITVTSTDFLLIIDYSSSSLLILQKRSRKTATNWSRWLLAGVANPMGGGPGVSPAPSSAQAFGVECCWQIDDVTAGVRYEEWH